MLYQQHGLFQYCYWLICFDYFVSISLLMCEWLVDMFRHHCGSVCVTCSRYQSIGLHRFLHLKVGGALLLRSFPDVFQQMKNLEVECIIWVKEFITINTQQSALDTVNVRVGSLFSYPDIVCLLTVYDFIKIFSIAAMYDILQSCQ